MGYDKNEELAKKVFPEGCKYLPRNILSLAGREIVMDIRVQQENSRERGLGNRFEWPCYRCGKRNCEVRHVGRHHDEERYAQF